MFGFFDLHKFIPSPDNKKKLALIINIDTATESASVCLSMDSEILGFFNNDQQKEHASFLHHSIQTVLHDCNKSLIDVDAFAVTSGPGSYTGLRVSMATAKGFCYTLSKPLIMVNTLKVMCLAANKYAVDELIDCLFCPMIDARRMEVFTAVYNSKLESVVDPHALIVTDNFCLDLLKKKRILFFGNGSEKFKKIATHINIFFANVEFNANDLSKLAYVSYLQRDFADTTYSQPQYFKPFHSNT